MNNEEKILAALTDLTKEITDLKGELTELKTEAAERSAKAEERHQQLFQNQIDMHREWAAQAVEFSKLFNVMKKEHEDFRAALVVFENEISKQFAAIFEKLDQLNKSSVYDNRLLSLERRTQKHEEEIFVLKDAVNS